MLEREIRQSRFFHSRLLNNLQVFSKCKQKNIFGAAKISLVADWWIELSREYLQKKKKQIENGSLNKLTEEHLFCLRAEDFCICGLVNSIDVERCFCKNCLSLVSFYWILTEINQLIIPYISVEGKRGLWKALNR